MTNTAGIIKKPSNKQIEVLQSEPMSSFCNLLHFISTRNGGVSSGEFESLNLKYNPNDSDEQVDENRKTLCQNLGIKPEQLIIPEQVHKDKVEIIDQRFMDSSKIEQQHRLAQTDALITNIPGVCISVATADCVPILVYAPDKQVIAAIHAGWRGTVALITTKTIQQLIDIFRCDPEKLVCTIGPCISQDIFEVGEEVVDSFKAATISLSQHGKRNLQTGKMHLDLAHINKDQLIAKGVLSQNIEHIDFCTYTHPELFFSARRQGIQSGRMLSGICLR